MKSGYVHSKFPLNIATNFLSPKGCGQRPSTTARALLYLIYRVKLIETLPNHLLKRSNKTVANKV